MGVERRLEIETMSFSPNGMRLAVGMGTTIHILNTETGAQLHMMKLSSRSMILSIDYKFCLPGSYSRSKEAGACTDVQDEMEIEVVHHPMADVAAEIPSLEAAQMQDELWASSVERRIAAERAAAEAPQTFVLLTFARQTQLLEQALLASPLALDATWCVQPDWASGAKLFVNLER